MAVKHSTTKSAGDKLYAVDDWNAVHVSDGNPGALLYVNTDQKITSDNSKITVDTSTGNIGIGTTTANSTLSINGAGYASYGLYVNGGSGNGIYVAAAATGVQVTTPNIAISGICTGGIYGVYGQAQGASGYGVYGDGSGSGGYGGYFTGDHAGIDATSGYGGGDAGVWGHGSAGVVGDGTTFDFYALNGSGKSYFAGKVGIQVGSPNSNFAVAGLSVYANNAAAIAGGLSTGDFYRDGGDPDHVCVVH